MIPFYREDPIDPERLATDPGFWAAHAVEELIAREARAAERVWNQIQEMHNDRCKAN